MVVLAHNNCSHSLFNSRRKRIEKGRKINGSVISFVLQNSAFNDVSAQTDIKLSPEDSDSSVSNKAYAKTSYKAGTTLDTLKSEVKFVIADESIATVDEITFEAGSAETQHEHHLLIYSHCGRHNNRPF